MHPQGVEGHETHFSSTVAHPQNLTRGHSSTDDTVGLSTVTQYDHTYEKDASNVWYIGKVAPGVTGTKGSTVSGAGDANQYTFTVPHHTIFFSVTRKNATGQALRRLRLIPTNKHGTSTLGMNTTALASVVDNFVSLDLRFIDFDMDGNEIGGFVEYFEAGLQCPYLTDNSASYQSPDLQTKGSASVDSGICKNSWLQQPELLPTSTEFYLAVYVVSEDCITNMFTGSNTPNPYAKDNVCTTKRLVADGYQYRSIQFATIQNVAFSYIAQVGLDKLTHLALYSYAITSDGVRQEESLYPAGYLEVNNLDTSLQADFLDYDLDPLEIGGNMTIELGSPPAIPVEFRIRFYMLPDVWPATCGTPRESQGRARSSSSRQSPTFHDNVPSDR